MKDTHVASMRKLFFFILVFGIAGRTLAQPAGYNLVFSDDFTDIRTIDIYNSGRAGYNWYMGRFYWNTPSPPNSVSLGPDGLTLSAQVSTAAGLSSSSMVGKAWGKGAYFEAMIWFDPDKVFVENGHWPAFYGLSWEVASKTDQAPGQTVGYEHFGEIDFMEYGFWNHRGSPGNYFFFWQTMHDWWGIKSITCPDGSWCGIMNNNLSAMRVSDVRGWHRYGSLWSVGDTTHNSSVQAYFDGQPIGNPVTWPAAANAESVVTPPTSATAYQITDFNHFIVVLEANAIAPIKVRYVKVWQLPQNAK